jgi:hypothetical protein
MSEPIPQDYGHLLGEIKVRICSAHYRALRKINGESISVRCFAHRVYRAADLATAAATHIR